ncbi:hypothetical protein C7B62_21570 [Pleurocapsa sp. CCALA 161]|uniref:response regulator n=1 Tax=Pleurocapsa sp. CCALA 161 TaxID=2107688 RepID=UPI000D072BF8|nr:response regulator [Pleurocapsa sp. CCALA 161]PSB06887.1 hypothetical protein C7B62_21570 [Pleurocapsa sp. CCALA 161]
MILSQLSRWLKKLTNRNQFRSKGKLLLVESDRSIGELLTEALNEQNYVVDFAANAQAARNFVEAFDYDLIIPLLSRSKN